MNDLQQKLLAAFEVEHKEHLDASRSLLDDMEQAGWSNDTARLIELHRRIHSLKGAARAVDFRPIETLSHRLETVIEQWQKGECPLDDEVGRIVRGALDAIEDGVVEMNRGGKPAPPADIMDALDALASGKLRPAGNAEVQPDRVTTSAAEKSAPPHPHEARVETDLAEHPLPNESFRIDARSLDGLLQCAGEILTATTHHGRLNDDFDRIERNIAECTRAVDVVRRHCADPVRDKEESAAAARRASGVRTLENQVQSLASSFKALERSYRADLWERRQFGRRFDSQIRQARMVPADSVFGGARKMVRDLLRDQGKEARVDVRGLNRLADRWVLQTLKDPVMHVLRNAVTHGIEPPEDREAAGKPREGQVILDIALHGSRLSICVEDDGRGIDVERIRDVAQARGAAAFGGGENPDALEITEILSQPGFSTAKSVTELAGRGIGLSVVSQAARKLQGDFRMEARQNGGTAVVIMAPVLVSSQKLVMVTCGDDVFGLPSHGIERLFRISKEQIDTVEGRPVMLREGHKPLPLAPLSVLLGRDDYTMPERGLISVVALASRERWIGALVDSVMAVREGVIRDIGLAGKRNEAVAGGLITETGLVVPVLNIPALFDEFYGKSKGWRLAEETGAVTEHERTVLVVDDSITTRTLEKSILEANGYRVLISVDGAAALEKLRSHPVDLVISDVEMPKMNGFELLRSIRQDSALARLPVILVTSRSKDEDRRRGLTLGADAYVVKQRFDQNALLEAIAKLL